MNFVTTLLLIISAFQINCRQIQTGTIEEEGRKKQQDDMMSKILPMMVMPFMVQTTLLPMMLMSMKFMLLKSMFLGKLAILFGFVTFLKNMLNNGGGLFSHNVNVQQSHHHDLAQQNYGYQRKRRKKREL
ncbi:hypothetical protein TcasGA2_TC031893 [Tribolium castaneum]|uniref:Uncharacterized protein n=1 Tax=Tribolium castaneum TaxID=7070 RepID=A0A139WA46_TRICA|nr:PREDICTED: uncharacterized protein LOC103315176 [Tribolium castaneum]KYB24793.1 hypothetical protein TcasGA2_TC031893 [Tribolium castaneum]|eukprot:XP_008201400.1 PREDICTED: uncharacterized protein LOC103315176 [Tribolium castaneum]